jgi:DNA modification methylase
VSDIILHHGDCLAILPTLEAGSVDAIVTDPPFGTEVGRDGYGRRLNYGGVGRKIVGDNDLSALDGMLYQVGRILVRDSWLAIFCSPKRHAETADLIESRGFPVAGEVVWDKASPGLGGGIRYQHEIILLCEHGNPAGRDSLFSVIRAHLSRDNKQQRHPHEKPVALLTSLVCYCSRPGDTVLDPFAGSGSTLVACRKAGRIGVGIEIDEQWIPTIERRLKEAEMPLLSGINPTKAPLFDGL